MIYKCFAGTSNNSEREESDTAPSHWAPYADAERDNHDSYRRWCIYRWKLICYSFNIWTCKLERLTEFHFVARCTVKSTSSLTLWTGFIVSRIELNLNLYCQSWHALPPCTCSPRYISSQHWPSFALSVCNLKLEVLSFQAGEKFFSILKPHLNPTGTDWGKRVTGPPTPAVTLPKKSKSPPTRRCPFYHRSRAWSRHQGSKILIYHLHAAANVLGKEFKVVQKLSHVLFTVCICLENLYRKNNTF